MCDLRGTRVPISETRFLNPHFLLFHVFWRVSVKKHTSPRVSGANLEQVFLTISLNTRSSPQVHILSSATSEVSLKIKYDRSCPDYHRRWRFAPRARSSVVELEIMGACACYFLLVRYGTAMTGGVERSGWGHRRAPRDVERPLCRRRVVAQPGAARRRHAAPPRRVPPSADTIRRTCVTSDHVVQSLAV